MHMITFSHTATPPKDGVEPIKHTSSPESSEKETECNEEESRRFPVSVGLCLILLIGGLCLAFVITFAVRPFWFLPKTRIGGHKIVPFVRQGNLAVYPPYTDRQSGDKTDGIYLFTLPPGNAEEVIKSLSALFESYPLSWTSNYTDCWVENPTFNKPCYFNYAWLGTACNEATGFGYVEKNGEFNPCVVVRLQKTGDWTPIPEGKDELPTLAVPNFAPQFLQLYCTPKSAIDAKRMSNIEVFPPRGFSTQFFPVANFSSKLYLPPAVAVQIKGIRKGENVTVECALLAKNPLELWDSGLVTLIFHSG